MHLFCYGTLCLAEIMRRLIGRLPQAEAALLHGYARYSVVGAAYPALLAQPQARTDGVLYRNLGFAEIKKLDHYEGPEYRLHRVTVETATGPCNAVVYLWIAQRQRLSDVAWHLERFRREQLARYYASGRTRRGQLAAWPRQ